ncbi:MAG TPA: HU family DNA-binding protein [Rhodothermales bacterium]
MRHPGAALAAERGGTGRESACMLHRFSRKQLDSSASTAKTSPPPPVTKADIIDRIAAGTGLTKIETEAVVNGFIATIIQALKEGETIEIRGFGSFRVQPRAARVARNPRTNEEVEVGPRFVPTLRVSRDVRDAVDKAVKELYARRSAR